MLMLSNGWADFDIGVLLSTLQAGLNGEPGEKLYILLPANRQMLGPFRKSLIYRLFLLRKGLILFREINGHTKFRILKKNLAKSSLYNLHGQPRESGVADAHRRVQAVGLS
jgi:hypothetical protein